MGFFVSPHRTFRIYLSRPFALRARRFRAGLALRLNFRIPALPRRLLELAASANHVVHRRRRHTELLRELAQRLQLSHGVVPRQDQVDLILRERARATNRALHRTVWGCAERTSAA